MTIEWDGDDPAAVAAKLDALPAALESSLKGAMQDIGQRIRGDAADGAPVDTGQLASSIEAVVASVGQALVELRVGTNREGAATQEFGADPFFPPPSELRDWARRVLGDADAAFPVARSIAETGIDAQPYLRPAFEENLTWAVDRINNAVTDAIEAVGLTS